MAINENIKTGYDARLVSAELKKAAEEIALGILMTGGMLDPMGIVYTLDKVATDFETWAKGKGDTEEVFIPVAVQAQLDQTHAQVTDFVTDFKKDVLGGFGQ